MAFTELDIKDLYVTDTDNIPEEFYGIALPHTVLYKRAAGFFFQLSFGSAWKRAKGFLLLWRKHAAFSISEV